MLINLILLFFLILCILMLITGLVSLFSGVPYVPTPHKTVRKMIDLAKLKHGEKVFDLGCGDGRLLYEAEKHTKTGGVGYELAPIPYYIAKIKGWLKKSKIKLHMKSLFKADLSEANVLFCYLMPHMLRKLTDKIITECQSGTRIISHGFKIEGLKPKQIFARDKEKGLPTIYLYELE